MYIYIVAILLIGCTAPNSPVDSSLSAGKQLSYSKGSISRSITDSPFTHVLTVSDVPGDTGAITYSSSSPEVAAVDRNSGEVTIAAAGTTTITAAKAATDDYQKHTAQYLLTVTKAPGKQLSYREGRVSRPVTDKGSQFTNLLTVSDVSGDTGTITYSSSSPGVATVNSGSGEVTIVAAGRTTITASKAATDDYQEHSAQYVLTVRRMEGRQLSYKTLNVRKTTTDGPFTEPLSVSDVPGDTGTILYRSSNPAVARVDRNSGEVTIVGVGQTDIMASKKQTDVYATSFDFYILIVTAGSR